MTPPLPHPLAENQRPDAGKAAFSVGASAQAPEILRKRADFLAAARARRQSCPAFLLQARDRQDDRPARVGFTCSKKLGNAVTRNRAKRRLRAIVRQIMPTMARPGWDYVLVGRPEATISRDFADMTQDLAKAMRKVHG